MCQKEPVLQAGFGVEPVKELMHESGPFPGDAAARGRQHAAGQLAQFHQIFPVGGILAAVLRGTERLLAGVMEPRVLTSGKQESAADPDRSKRVELVRIIDNLRLSVAGIRFAR